jgi:hypothetical protein
VGLGVDDVEATAYVHEHLGEARVGDDGIDDERVYSRIGDVVRMVTTVERDGCFGLVKEKGVVSCTEKISRCSCLRWRLERHIEGPP